MPKLSKRPSTLLVLALIMVLPFSLLAFGDRSVTITVTINIEPFQQLQLSSQNEAIDVVRDGSRGVSRVEINEVNSSVVTLDPAVSAKVKSNVGWRILAHAEDGYINGDVGVSGGPRVELGVGKAPPAVNKSYAGSWVDIGKASSGTGLVEGPHGTHGPFDVAYRLDFGEADPTNIEGAGVDVVYTMMQL